MKAQIQGDASAAAAAIGGDLSSLTGELRNLIPQGAALPNINLQSQLSSLASISNPAQAANLLSNITSNFGTELSAAGFNLDTLVSDTKAAIAGGKSLSFSIPNFEKPADGVSAAFQKAVAVKIPDKDTVKEIIANFNVNDAQENLKKSIKDAVISVSSTPPTEDTEKIKITDKGTNITQQGISRKSTTAKDAIEGQGAELKRKNYSSFGFTSVSTKFTESFIEKNMTISSTNIKVKLFGFPTRITKIQGLTEDAKLFLIFPSPVSRSIEAQFDTFTISGNEITISTRLRKYDEIFVVYNINSKYDPHYKTA
tara:strand:- start:772 stop:1707 length:936 start_codon:yes stop_codon:yes gene_type:complete